MHSLLAPTPLHNFPSFYSQYCMNFFLLISPSVVCDEYTQTHKHTTFIHTYRRTHFIHNFLYSIYLYLMWKDAMNEYHLVAHENQTAC